MVAGDYVPEYLRARLSAGVMFSMMRVEPKIDSLSETGDFKVIVLFLYRSFNCNKCISEIVLEVKNELEIFCYFLFRIMPLFSYVFV